MASKNIRGITIQIGADVTQLDKGLKTADKSIKQVQNELKEVEKALQRKRSPIYNIGIFSAGLNKSKRFFKRMKAAEVPSQKHQKIKP